MVRDNLKNFFCELFYFFLDYLEPIMQNVKQNLEYFDDPNQKKINSIILKNTKKFPKIIKKNQYYNDSFI